jgi:two-component system, OmpR family, sensor kinase
MIQLRRWWHGGRPALLSIRWRLTIWYTGVVAITLAVFSLLIYYYMGTRMVADISRVSEQRALQVADTVVRKYRTEFLDPLSQAQLTRLGLLDQSVDPFNDPGVGVRVYDYRGVLRDGSTDSLLDVTKIPDDRVFIVEAIHGRSYEDVLNTHSGRFYAYSRPILQSDGQLWAVVQILTSLQQYDSTMRLLRGLLLGGTLFATALAFITGAAMAQTALAPMGAITRTARRINRTQDLGRRIKVSEAEDEVGQLAATINDMLDRIQSMFDQQRQFLADVSHELRTPLTTIRGELDIMTRSGRLDGEALAAMSDEAERMSRLVGDLLLLAKADQDQIEIEHRPVELDTLLLDVFRQSRTLAGEARTVELGHEDAATVIGDRDRLKQLLLNLVNNALTHTPPGTRVILSLDRDGEMARLQVADNGPGISLEEQRHIFDRFYRVDKARHRGNGSTGLGLAIARCVAVAHGGQISVTSSLGQGTTFTVLLPQAPSSIG